MSEQSPRPPALPKSVRHINADYAAKVPWRVGRTLGRTVCCGPDDRDLLGMMETPELAAYVVWLHNERLAEAGR